MKDIIKSGILATLIVAFLYLISQGMTCGIIKLIALCLGLRFRWAVATGVWLIMCIVKNIFSRN